MAEVEVECSDCGGSGLVDCDYCGTPEAAECDTCGGTGQEIVDDEDLEG